MQSRDYTHCENSGCRLENRQKNATEEKIQGLLENIFGLQMPKQPRVESVDEEKMAGMLTNVFGIKLPSEMVPAAYSIILSEYGQN